MENKLIKDHIAFIANGLQEDEEGDSRLGNESIDASVNKPPTLI